MHGAEFANFHQKSMYQLHTILTLNKNDFSSYRLESGAVLNPVPLYDIHVTTIYSYFVHVNTHTKLWNVSKANIESNIEMVMKKIATCLKRQ